MAGLLYAERQNAPGIEMFDRRQPAAQVLRLRCRGGPDCTGNARFDLGDGDRRKLEPVAMGAHPGRESLHADLPRSDARLTCSLDVLVYKLALFTCEMRP